ncbi:histidine--tRNA ligase [Clostridiaceae bacterium NSJ-31]|uniref:Histidine--tRNA ligase n=1 Tax=Ligaoa zhengdingensis TaxID=2763658 RepID=A0A926I124_9FIRM|nr:histidine--tRNA ligase [Ligaoa zhengdingensis]MBC8547622.1 histidine--tRNA ligase [Ligaoa zhengdingensis]
MALLTQAPKGTQDVLPRDSYKWQYVEGLAMEIARLYGFQEMRVPTFEHTELFNRSVGDTTDVVQKEMYTFLDKGNRSITLRPEGTAGMARAAVQNGLLNEALPLKVSYLVSCFRYEKPQAGRLREFHQFGAEVYGSDSPACDAEVIAMVGEIFDTLGVRDLRLELNSIGCPECRARYHKALKEYFAAHMDELCDTCRERLEKNPMRILDCKSPVCHKIAKDAPKVLDYICEGCSAHFEGVKARLDALGMPYVVNPTIVRGLDYYTKTVFEFVTDQIGAQGTVCGGGRYDGLLAEIGGPKLPGIGFAMGIERLLKVMDACGAEFPEQPACAIYIGSIGEAASVKAFALVNELREEGFWAECDTMGRGVKAQMKYADKLGCRLSCILGDNELESGRANVKNMRTGETHEVAFDDLIDFVYDAQVAVLTESIRETEINP